MTNREFQLFRVVTGGFYTSMIPEHWDRMNPTNQTEWMDEHTWAPFENMDREEVWNAMDATFQDVLHFVRNNYDGDNNVEEIKKRGGNQ